MVRSKGKVCIGKFARKICESSVRLCKYAEMNWDDLKFVLVTARAGSLSAAARTLGVDQTTVSRRLAALELSLGKKLFLRVGHRLVATEYGESAADNAEQMESRVAALQQDLSDAGNTAAGPARLTAVPLLINHLLIPNSGTLLAAHPELRLELIADPRNLSISKRDTDIAIRLAQPTSGTALCRRLGSLSYSVYSLAGTEDLPWLTYGDEQAHLPQAQWVARETGETAALRANDAEGLWRGVLAGLGQAVLPDFLAAPDARLQRLSDDAVLDREAWLLVHNDMRHLPRISVVVDWLDDVFVSL